MARVKAKRPAGEGLVYQVKVTLESSKPPIWRRLLVAADTTLGGFHDILQVAMGWHNGHMHAFQIDHQYYGNKGPYGLDDVLDEDEVKLGQVVTGAKFKFRYQYDFGDSWTHLILVEKVLEPDSTLAVPSCVKGKRACPPEDCGGIWGYAELLKKLADPAHSEHDEMVEWLDEDFDPEGFDLEAINKQLKRFG